jgi:hypothetical protein
LDFARIRLFRVPVLTEIQGLGPAFALDNNRLKQSNNPGLKFKFKSCLFFNLIGQYDFDHKSEDYHAEKFLINPFCSGTGFIGRGFLWAGRGGGGERLPGLFSQLSQRRERQPGHLGRGHERFSDDRPP